MRTRRALAAFSILTLALLAIATRASAAQTTIHIPADQPTIQAGIDAAHNGDTVLVSPGTYYENIDFKGKAITVTSSGGSAVTTIDGGTQTATVQMVSGESRSAVLSNLTITGGRGLYYTPQGGIYISDSQPTILGNVITHAQCYGINSQSSSPLIQANEISYTQAQPYECSFGSGAGVYLTGILKQATPVVIGNTIEYNTQSGLEDAGGNGGAGIAVWYATPVIENNIIRYNATGKYFSPAGGGSGGGIYFASDGGLVANNLIYGNTSNLAGGGIYLATENSGSPIKLAIINNTIVDNAVVPVTTYSQAVLGGQQLYYSGGSNPAYTVDLTLANNIVSGSSANASVVCFDGTLNPVVYTNNDFYNTAGPVTGVYKSGTCTFPAGTSGNITAAPIFANSSSQDYHALLTSPTVDTGDNSSLQLAAAQGVAPTTDLDGNPRIQNATGKGCIVDMGAYETAGTANTCGTQVALQTSLNPSSYGQTVTFTATASSTSSPAGSINFSDGTTVLATQSLIPVGSTSASASFTTSLLAVGTHSISATYVPGGTLPAGSAILTQTVLGLNTSAQLISSVNPSASGQSVTFTATITDTASPTQPPTGVVTFFDGTSLLGTVGVAALGTNFSVASFSTNSLSVGAHSITATYTPSTNFSSATASLIQVVTGFATTTSLSSSLNPANVGQSVTFTATVSTSSSVPGGLAGSVNFYDGAVLLINVPIVPGGSNSGAASFSTSSLAAGTHTITANFNSLAAFSTSSAQLTQTINKLASTTALTAAPNPALFGSAVTFTAAVTGSPTTPAGNITFYDSAAVLAIVQLNSSAQASFTTSSLAVGTHTLTASYSGDPLYASSTSAPFTEVIQPLPQDFTLTLASPSITIKTEHHTTTSLALAGINGFADSLAIACANLPQYVTCQPKPTPASLAAGATAAVSLYLDTDSVLGYAHLAAPPRPAPFSDRSAPVSFALLFAPFSFLSALALSRRRRAPLRLLALLLALLPTSVALSGCTTIIDAYDPPPAAVPGTYSIPITATGAATRISHTANLTLIITP